MSVSDRHVCRPGTGVWRFGAFLISGGLVAGLVWQSVRGTVTPGSFRSTSSASQAGRASGGGSSSESHRRSLASRALHRAMAHPVRPCSAASPLDGGRPVRHRPRAQALNDHAVAHDPSARWARPRSSRWRASCALRQQSSAWLGPSATTSTTRSPRPSAGVPSTPSSCSRSTNAERLRKTRSASTSMPSPGPGAGRRVLPSSTVPLLASAAGALQHLEEPGNQVRRHATTSGLQADPPKPLRSSRPLSLCLCRAS